MNTPLLDVLTAARDASEGDPVEEAESGTGTDADDSGGEALPELSFAPRATVCKYAVPEGYPDDPQGGTRIAIDEESVARAAEENDGEGEAILFYASVDERDDGIYTTTSRAFAVVGVAGTIAEAEAIAEEALSGADEGVRIRHDIGTEALVQSRIDHVSELRETR